MRACACVCACGWGRAKGEFPLICKRRYLLEWKWGVCVERDGGGPKAGEGGA